MHRYGKVLGFLTGVSLGLGLLVVLERFQVPFFLYYPRATDTILISEAFDFYLFLISSCCVPLTMVMFWKEDRFRCVTLWAIFAAAISLALVGESYGLLILYFIVLSMIPFSVSLGNFRHRAELQMLGFMTILALVEFSSIYSWIFASINPYGEFTTLSETTEASLSFSLFPLSIPLVLLLLSSWLWFPVVSRLLSVNVSKFRSTPIGANVSVDKRLLIASVDLFGILALLIFFFPYLAGQKWIVGVDSYIDYFNPLENIRGLSPTEALTASVKLSHGIYVGILYILALGTGISSFHIVKFAPLILAFVTASFVFLALRNAEWSFRTALLTAICTLLWLPTTLGIFSGIQANWSALALWMLFLSLLFTKTHRNVVIFTAECLVSAGIFLIHPWTWGVFFMSLLITAFLSARTPWRRQTLLALSSGLGLTVPLGLIAYLLLPGPRNDLTSTMLLYTYPLHHPIQLLSFGGALFEMLNNWSPFFSPALLIITLVGAYELKCLSDGVTKRYFLAWIFTWCIASILVAPLGYIPARPLASETDLWRTFYISPLPILLALGVERCLAWPQRLMSDVGSWTTARSHVTIVLVILGAPSLGLFLSPIATIRLLAVLAAVSALLLLSFRLPVHHLTLIVIATVLILVIVNAAFRSLELLLLDPHSLLGIRG
jgi:hypothetical protein